MHTYFTVTHGERLARELGEGAVPAAGGLDGVKAGLMVPADVERLPFAELQERRRTIMRRMGDTRPR